MLQTYERRNHLVMYVPVIINSAAVCVRTLSRVCREQEAMWTCPQAQGIHASSDRRAHKLRSDMLLLPEILATRSRSQPSNSWDLSISKLPWLTFALRICDILRNAL